MVELLAVITIIGLLLTLGLPSLWDMLDRARVAKAIGDLKAMAVELQTASTVPETLAGIGRAGKLDPWGRPYVYLKFPVGGKGKKGQGGGPPPGARKDRFLVPINSAWDLYSVGKDGGSVAPLTAKASRDDIVVANDGGFVGLARNY